ncbi:uncharacterized protein PV09_08926 [Verruconis gallopava]|uniref:Methyltransferase domain-containing protein n=1 Tax=Verruconis gallopava TaxID=253628 RepID=A0A0D1YF45_9PEZI|nr:uncharacterized protein PV09_08926 [Verruconis gallopava]KIV99381.1 hypothetical protein PV09_08926 [Verruconis gallopava]
MTAQTPGFGQRQYWEDRYTKNPKAYDWLNGPGILDKALDSALASAQGSAPRILHIGCGNSELSFNLRFKVRDPNQVHNVDFSSVVIDWGREREKSMFDSRWEDESGGSSSAAAASEPKMPMMKWDEVDLLSLQSVISNCMLGGYSVIIDKSTCDAIACAATAEISIPYFLYTDRDGAETRIDIADSYTGTVNAVQLLAVHLALVAAPKARWIAYSYSSTRFWFLDPDFEQTAEDEESLFPLHPGLPKPKDLWVIIERQEIAKPYGTSSADDAHYLYVLERTSVALKARSLARTEAEED